MKKLILAGLLLFSACAKDPPSEPTYPVTDLKISPLAGGHVWDVDTTNSKITFEFLEKGQSFEGKFDRFEIAINLNLEDPTSGQITALIDLVSVDAGTDDRNKVLRDSEMFYVREHPVARFHSEDIVRLPDGSYEARGELSLKDIRKAIVLPFSITHNGRDAIAMARFDMNRLDYRVGTGSFMDDKYVGYPVSVQIEVRAREQDVEKSLQ